MQHGNGREAMSKAPGPPAPLALADEASAASPLASPDAASLGGVDDGDDDEVAPPPRTAADRFRNIHIVQTALSADMRAYLQKIGVPLEGQKAASSTATEEVGLAEDVAAARECARLGLDGSAKGRLPMPGPLRLPVCTVELQQEGLWDRFRQRCGTPMPPEPPPIQCKLQKSKGGGQVVQPHTVAGPAAVAA